MATCKKKLLGNILLLVATMHLFVYQVFRSSDGDVKICICPSASKYWFSNIRELMNATEITIIEKYFDSVKYKMNCVPWRSGLEYVHQSSLSLSMYIEQLKTVLSFYGTIASQVSFSVLKSLIFLKSGKIRMFVTQYIEGRRAGVTLL